jgi:hypothetical protein
VEEARAKARETLEYWCKHVRIELRLDGEVVSGALDLDGLCKVEHREEGTHVVMALVPEAAALRGYYHGGLTLHEERDEALPHVAFKIDSRFFEHSLTRDNVIRDENYTKAMAIVGRGGAHAADDGAVREAGGGGGGRGGGGRRGAGGDVPLRGGGVRGGRAGPAVAGVRGDPDDRGAAAVAGRAA